ncbi:MAG: ABC transporter ATP-binding protein [Candidatus Wallbacteria bacterium]|nr:ABC transporter ATP-binding protein [Candidatus Wallbacteria bacterium]
MEQVCLEYRRRGKTVNALQDANLEICDGDYLSIVGPSGSGKSTLLLTLGGMLTPTKGRVMAGSESLYDLAPVKRAQLRREKIGFVFQTFNLIPYLTALENVQVPLLLAGASEARQQERAKQLLERLGLSDRLDHKPGELSVGQQQRVALARMLANEPSLILADEPTGNLDPDTGKEVLSFLEQLNAEGRTVVIVTHDHAAAERAKKRLRLENGFVHPVEKGNI